MPFNEQNEDISIDKILEDIDRQEKEIQWTADNNWDDIRAEYAQEEERRERRRQKAWFKPLRSLYWRIFQKPEATSVQRLLRLDGIAFINACYTKLLDRTPSFPELKHQIANMGQGGHSKVEIIGNIYQSAEGQTVSANIYGLWMAQQGERVSRGIKRIPVVGYIYRLVCDIIFLPRRLRAQQTGMEDNARLLSMMDDRYEQRCQDLEDEVYSLRPQIKWAAEQMAEQAKKQEYDQGISEAITDFYTEFKAEFRAKDRETIKRMCEPHLDALQLALGDRRNVRLVDLGCGEGEFLELLKENGYYNLRGVDSNRQFVANGNALGLDISEGDAIEYMKGLPDSSLDAVSFTHMIEHLELDELITLFQQCRRVLVKGGALIIETPNADNIITASINFYLDPTHKNPLPSLLLEFYTRHFGFQPLKVYKTEPSVFLQEDELDSKGIRKLSSITNAGQNLCIVAVKE